MSVPRRRGVALFAALTLMAIIGLLIGGMLATSTLAQRSARLTHSDAQLTAAADFALNTVVAESGVRDLAALPFGQAVTLEVPAGSGLVDATVSATRLSHGVVWLVAEARDAAATTGGRRRLNLVARWPWLGELPRAGIVARGRVRLGAGVTVTADTSGDPDCRVRAGGPAVIVGPGASVVSADSVTTLVDSSAADSSTFFLGAGQLPALEPSARFTHVRGDTTLTGGSIAGILLVDGQLVIAGPVTASGLIVAGGVVDAKLGSLRLTGALFSLAPYDSTRFAIELGGASIRHSPCEIVKEFRTLIPLRPVRKRGWVELF